MFTPIQQLADLPAPGVGREGYALDFKVRINVADRFEAAKDVAALANARGGTLLVGAATDGELLKNYVPLSSEDADGVQRCYEEAVRDRCRPVEIPGNSGQIVGVTMPQADRNWPARN